MTAAAPIHLRGLVKAYGSREVLHGIDLDVPAGCLFGFLGPNGAGKTTTIRILLGLLRATGGAVRVLGRDPWADGPRLRAEIGYLPGDVRLNGGWTGRATLDFYARVRGRALDASIQRLARRFELDLSRRVRTYSRGMKQKLGLIQALMHDPQLLILDEPTMALDPLMQDVLYAELRAFAAGGGTVLFSSHTLSEVEQLCDEVAILRDGRIIECERIEVLRRRAVRRVEIALRGGAAPAEPPAGLRIAGQRDGRYQAAWTGDAQALAAWLSRQPLADVVIAPPDLEDLFLAYYAGPKG